MRGDGSGDGVEVCMRLITQRRRRCFERTKEYGGFTYPYTKGARVIDGKGVKVGLHGVNDGLEWHSVHNLTRNFKHFRGAQRREWTKLFSATVVINSSRLDLSTIVESGV